MAPRSSADAASGVERRKNRLFVTRNSEYFTHDGVCVRVRDRRRDEWTKEHQAIGHRLTGALHVPRVAGELPVHDSPEPGDTLVFESGPHKVFTSPLERVSRPPREIVERTSLP